jgi:catechol 2,3-dioxygenase-like lactoylglutathione lyase family enzyme
MPSSIFHMVALTDDLDEVIRFLRDVVGMDPVREFGDDPATREQAEQNFGWPAGEVSVRGAVVGAGAGMIELVEIPDTLRDVEAPRVAMMTFATPDVEGYSQRAADAGFDAEPVIAGDGAVSTFAMAPVTVGGLPFEFIRFGAAARDE